MKAEGKTQWPVNQLGEVAIVGAGNSAPQKDELFQNGTIPFFRTSDAGRIRFGDIFESEDFLNDLGAKGLRRYPVGTILFPKSGASTFLNHRVMLGVEGCVSSHLATIVANPERIHSRFLLYFLSTVESQDLVQDHAYPSLNLPTISGIEVPIPPLPEQERIVGILDEAFDGIAKAKALAEANLQNARALFQSHLQSVFSQRGEGWVETTIEDHIKFIDYRGKTPVKTETGLRLITAKNVKMGFLQEAPKEFVAPKSYDAWMTRGIPKRGDVLFTTEAPLANVAQLDTDEKVVFAQRIIIMQPDPSMIESTFLKYLLLSQPVQDRIRSQGTGATVQGIKASLLKKIEISFPKSLDEQTKIVNQLDALSEETQRLESLYQSKLDALDELKKSLLHQAFSGNL
jgi:type I restriction enzyme S subunit